MYIVYVVFRPKYNNKTLNTFSKIKPILNNQPKDNSFLSYKYNL